MKIYEQRDTNKRVTHCPTCGNEGHMWMTCPVPAIQVDRKKKGLEPDVRLYSSWYQSSFSRRDENGKLIYGDRMFRSAERELQKQERRREALKQRREVKERIYGKKKRKVSCGFCGGTDHNRRNCDVMSDFIEDMTRANQNYRKKFYNKIVKEMGVAEGALVSLSATHALVRGEWVDDFKGIGIITGINWDDINLGVTMTAWDWKSPLQIELLVDGETMKSENPLNRMAKFSGDTDFSDLFSTSFSHWGLRIDEVIAPSENLPSDEWFNHGYEDCWEWIAKKYTLSDMQHTLTPLIAKFHPSTRGRNAGKLKKRLARYVSRK